MITNIVYILKTYFFLLYFILFSDLLCPLFMHTFWHLVIQKNQKNNAHYLLVFRFTGVHLNMNCMNVHVLNIL